MKRTLLIISAATVLLAGCSKEQLVEERSYTGPVTVVGATFESLTEDGTTKAAVTDAGTFTWQNGDKAAFAESSSSTSYCFGTNNVAGATAQFAIEGSHTFTNSSLAIYPDDLTTGQVPTTLKVKVPASRVWVNEQTNVAMYGKYETASSSFSFSHMGGLVRVRVKNVPTNAREFVFKASGCKINGEFTPESEGSYNVIKTTTSSTEGEQTYTLTWTTAPTAENTTDFYIPLPVGTYSGGFAFYLNDGEHNVLYSKVGSTSQTIARKKLLLMPAITLVGGSIEPVEKAAIVANIPAGYSGDYLLPQSEKVILKINASDSDKDITLKYDGANIPTNLEVKVVDGDNAGNYNAKLLGNLPSTHVEFTQGHIDATELTTSSSTLAVINPATVGTLTVKGGNVLLKGATVTSIVVDNTAVASEETKAPVQIVMEKYTPTGGTEQTPAVTNKIEANADVVVAPVQGVTVKVEAPENVKVAKDGEGTVNDKNNQPITTQAAAKIGEAKYITLADAIAAVKDNETIEMIADVDKANGISVPSGKNFTVDFGGHTYTCLDNPTGSTNTTNQVFQLNAGNAITFKNGTINVAEANKTKFRFIIQNYADLTLEDMTLDGTNLGINNSRYTLSNNAGNINLTGKTSIKAAAEKGTAFDIYYWPEGGYSTAPVLTWNSTGDVEGRIELAGATFIVEKDLKVTTPIRAIKNANGQAKLTVKAGATISPLRKFSSNVQTAFANSTKAAPNTSFNEFAGGVVIVNRGANLLINGDGKISTTSNEEWCYSAVCLTEKGESESAPTNADRAKLTVEGNVTLEGYYYGVVGNGSRHDTDITISGGTIKGIKANDCTGIYHPQKGNLTISGGTIEGATGIYVKSGDVQASVTAGTIKGVGTNCKAYNPARVGDGCDPTGDALVIDNCGYPGGQPTVEINGGTFISDHYKAVASYAKTGFTPITGFIHGGTFSDLSGVEYVADNGTYKLANDVTLANPLEINSGKAFSIDLNGKTLTGRTNIKHGNVTFKNGNINGGNLQALNVYGSSESSATNYSVVTVDSDVTVTAEVFGVCLFGPVYNSNVGYGAGIDVKGTITTTKNSSSNEGAVFVSGNLGGGKDADTQTAMEGKNFVNISGTVTSASDAALALQGSATATITGTLTGNTGIAAKRGKLIVKENAVITGNGACVGNPASNGNGTELTGSAVSASSTYGQKLTIDLQGGTYTSAAYTILNNAVDDACTFNISGGRYESTKSGDGIAVYARLGSVNITGGEFINNSNSEATLHVGCPSADLSNGPKLTILGNDTVVKNNASGDYTYGGKPLVVNMANQLTYKAVEISGGKFYYRNPSKDDNVVEPNGNFLKDGFSVSGDETNGWTVSANQN